MTQWKWPKGFLPPAKYLLEALLLAHKPVAHSALLAARRDCFGSFDWIAVAACASSATCTRAIRGENLVAFAVPVERAVGLISAHAGLLQFVPEYDPAIGEIDGYSVCAAVWGSFGSGEVECDSSALNMGPIEGIDDLLDCTIAELQAKITGVGVFTGS